jgi:hypothetical protein
MPRKNSYGIAVGAEFHLTKHWCTPQVENELRKVIEVERYNGNGHVIYHKFSDGLFIGEFKITLQSMRQWVGCRSNSDERFKISES